MEKEVEAAIIASAKCAAKEDLTPDEALKYTQAILNATHALIDIKTSLS